MLDTVKINHVQHISFTQSRLTDAVSVILSELLSYEHPSNPLGGFSMPVLPDGRGMAGRQGQNRAGPHGGPALGLPGKGQCKYRCFTRQCTG